MKSIFYPFPGTILFFVKIIVLFINISETASWMPF